MPAMGKAPLFIFLFFCVSEPVLPARFKASLNRRIVTHEFLAALGRIRRLKHPNGFHRQNADADSEMQGDLLSLDSLGWHIQHSFVPAEANHFGPSFGPYISFSRFVSQDSSATLDLSALEIFINEDYSSAEGRLQQDELEALLDNFNRTQSCDPQSAFFPEFFGVFDVTRFFPTFVKDSTPPEQTRALVPGKNQALLVLLLQGHDQTLCHYLQELSRPNVYSFLHSRLRLARNVAQGLHLLAPQSTHCDIKPGNLALIMQLKHSLDYLAPLGVLPVSLYKPNLPFHVQILGQEALASHADPSKRRCAWVTPGFFSIDMIEGSPHDKVDSFALAVTMLDFELSELKLGRFSELNAEIMASWKPPGFDFKPDQVERLKGHAFVQLLMQWGQGSSYQDSLVTRLGELAGSIESILGLKKPLRTVALEQYLFLGANFFLLLIKLGLVVFWKEYYLEVQVPKEAGEWQSHYEITQAQLDSFPEKYKTGRKYEGNQLRSTCFSQRQKLVEAEAATRRKLALYYIRVIFADYSKRHSIGEFLERVRKLQEHYEQENGDLIRAVDRCRLLVGDDKTLVFATAPPTCGQDAEPRTIRFPEITRLI